VTWGRRTRTCAKRQQAPAQPGQGRIYEGNSLALTFSAGIFTLQAEDSGARILRRADMALLAARDAGRDHIQIA